MEAYTNLTDQELLALLKQGNHAAFNRIYKRYSKMLLDAAYKRLGSVEEAEEIIQDLFIDLYIRKETIEITSNLEAFFRTALKYRVFNVYRSKITRERYAALVQNENNIELSDPLKQLEAKELARKIQQATLKLPKKCREVFLLSKVEHLSNKSIAEKLGISVSTVEQHITKAIKLLKTDFDHYDQGLVLLLLILYHT